MPHHLIAIACLAVNLNAMPVPQDPADRWNLVFADEFTGENRPLDDWRTFGDATSRTEGRTGGGLLLSVSGGRAESALGGGATRDERISLSISWRDLSGHSSDASLALKIEYFDVNGAPLATEETLMPVGEARKGWNDATVTGVVPARARRIDAAVVLVPGPRPVVARVLVDELKATRSAPPIDLIGAGGFESADANAPGWSGFNNAVAIDHPDHGRVLRTWGPYNEPYGGSGIQQTIAVPGIPAGTLIEASVEAMTEDDDSIARTDNFPILRLECLAGDGRPLAHRERRPFDPGDAAVPVDRWVETAVGLPAPEGTASIKMIIVFIQPTTEKGSILFRRPRLSVEGMETAALRNPELRSGGSAVPGWTASGDVGLDAVRPHSGANAVRLGHHPDRETSIIRPLRGWTPASTVSIDGWATASEREPVGSATIEIEVVQTGADGRVVRSNSRSLETTTTNAWRSLAAERPFEVEIAPKAAEVDLIVRATDGAVLLDDVSVHAVGDAVEGPIPIPIRNPGFEGMRPDPEAWIVADGAWSHNRELQYYAPDSISIADGRMRIVAEKRKVGDRPYSSGHVRTTDSLAQTYGRWEIRAKLPDSQGMWPAIWLLPTDGSWPPEIDIIELVGKEPGRVHHSFHWGPLRDGLLPWDLGQTSTDHHDAADYADTWHDFAVEWTPRNIVWYVDGVETHRFGTTPEERALIPDAPMYLIINTAIGGFWPGPPGDATRWPSVMEIDRVRIYEHEDGTD